MNGLTSIFRQVVESLRFGSDDPRVATVSLAIAAASIALLVLIGLVVHSLLSARGDERRTGLPTTDGRSAITWSTIVLLALLLAFGFGSHYAARDDVCARCHLEQADSSSVASHSGVRCVGCHRAPGPVGFVLWQLDYARWLGVTLSSAGDESPASETHVNSRSCLSCHHAVTTGVTIGEIMRVRHVDFLERPCVECHNMAGHGEQARMASRPDMRTCLICHDAQQVSSECGLCHVGDVAFASRRADPRPAPIRVAAPTGTDCRGCHDTESCNECHGVEMPHPPDWMPTHARPAFESPSVCWRCHPGPELTDSGPHPWAMCNRCHRFPGPHGPTRQWVRDHGAAALKTAPRAVRSRCSLCHTNPRFCDLCHTGREERIDY